MCVPCNPSVPCVPSVPQFPDLSQLSIYIFISLDVICLFSCGTLISRQNCQTFGGAPSGTLTIKHLV